MTEFDEHDPFNNPEQAHARARELMVEPFFWDCVDELAPFGSDEGATAYDEWRSWRFRNPTRPIAECFNWILSGQLEQYNASLCSDEQIEEDARNPNDAFLAEAFDIFTLDVTIIATALGQLIDEGTIDSHAKPYVRVAICRQRHPAVRTFEIQRLDAIERVVNAAWSMQAARSPSAKEVNMEDDRPAVSPNNPCPFLRSLVAEGLVDDARVPLKSLAKTITSVAKTSESNAQLSSAAIYAIALIANGLGPVNLIRNQFNGVRLNELRNGPLDKKGVGSRILDSQGQVQLDQLERLSEFASDKTAADGSTELGLNLEEISRMMDANFARAKGHRRKIDRRLMNGEWPVLLQVLGKVGQDEPYLAVDDVAELCINRRLPKRMVDRMANNGQ